MTTLLRAEDAPLASRLDYWRGVVCETFVPFDMRIDAARDFRGQVLSGEVGTLSVSAVTGPPSEISRTPRLIRRLDPDLCKIDLQVRGRGVFAQHDREATLEPGGLTFVDLSRPCRWAFPGDDDHGLVGVVFPRTLLPLSHDEAARLAGVRIPGDKGTGALVAALVLRMVRNLDDYGTAAGVRISAALLDLLAVALQERLGNVSAVPADTRRHALLLRVHAFIEERLGDPRLSPGCIAAAHHVSTRYLNKLFQEQGMTVTGWVRNRRLDRCRRDLLNPTLATRPVSAIGARWGLTDAAHFNRVFRAAYGIPPAAYRMAHAQPKGNGDRHPGR